ncbi:MAG: hypothetical protein CSA62_02210 [Planctomycetota bacterium]|nr:MAG: hypothetical protein CSA62_02210 [Planctomycetota bacterium]
MDSERKLAGEILAVSRRIRDELDVVLREEVMRVAKLMKRGEFGNVTLREQLRGAGTSPRGRISWSTQGYIEAEVEGVRIGGTVTESEAPLLHFLIRRRGWFFKEEARFLKEALIR